MRLTKFANVFRWRAGRVEEQGRTKATERNGKMAGPSYRESRRGAGGIKEQEREREKRRERGRKILPGVTNALPRGGEVSSMFMPWFTGLPIVPNGPRPRCCLLDHILPFPSPFHPGGKALLVNVALCRLHLSTHIFRSLPSRANPRSF